jgi:uncharacterized protein YgfB (UPF0149 family)
LLCAPGPASARGWLEELLGEADASSAALATCREVLGACLARSAEELSSGGFAFAPLLPDDEAPLVERCAALGEWCGGFLYGLGSGGLRELSSLPPEVREALADLGQLARLAGETGETGEPDGEERDYAELVEYVRVAVMSVYEDSAGGSVTPARSG